MATERKPDTKRWFLLAAAVAVVALLARYLWKRRSERRT